MTITERGDGGLSPTTLGNYRDWQGEVRSFSALGAYFEGAPLLFDGEEPKAFRVVNADPGVFRVLNLRAVAGRFFGDAIDTDDAQSAVLTSSAWTNDFGRRVDIVGQTVSLDGLAYTIVGVAPPEVRWIFDADIFVPFPTGVSGRGPRIVNVIGRLRDGVTESAATQELNRVVSSLERAHPDNSGFRSGVLLRLRDELFADVKGPVIMLGLLVGVLTATVVASLVGIQFVRFERRTREMAVRYAIGASPFALVGQACVEGLFLSFGALLLGIGSSAWLFSVGRGVWPESLMFQQLRLEPGSMVFAAVMSGAIGLLSVLCSVFMLRRSVDAGSLLRATDASGVRVGTRRLQAVVVVVQAALAVLFAVAVTTSVEQALKRRRIDVGFDYRNLWSMEIKTYGGLAVAVEDQSREYREIVRAVRSLPGVLDAGGINRLPLDTVPFSVPFSIQGTALPSGERVQFRLTTPGYFQTMGIPVESGRAFSDGDDRLGERVVLVNNAFVDRYLAGRYPIGRRVSIVESPLFSVVGTVGDVKSADQTEPSPPELYLSTRQASSSGEMTVVIRTSGLQPAMGQLRALVRSIAPHMAVASLTSIESLVFAPFQPQRVASSILAAMALLSVGLVVAGQYSLSSYVLSGRRRELAVRRALGAEEGRLTLEQGVYGVYLHILGVSIGVALAVTAARAWGPVIVGSRSIGLLTLIWVVVAVMCLGIWATYAPTRHAVCADLSRALRT